MAHRAWLITGVSSGFGRQLAEQLLVRGDRVLGTVRNTGNVADLIDPTWTRSEPRCST
jgi:NAD(P)-dependent dehydrogenase (short-subunit alcohol dehydrogenase family)